MRWCELVFESCIRRGVGKGNLKVYGLCRWCPDGLSGTYLFSSGILEKGEKKLDGENEEVSAAM